MPAGKKRKTPARTGAGVEVARALREEKRATRMRASGNKGAAPSSTHNTRSAGTQVLADGRGKKHGSGLGLVCCNLGRAIGADQLGPDQVPVFGAKVPSPHNTAHRALDLGAPLRRNTARAIQPVPDVLLLYPDGRSKGCLASNRVNGNL